MLVKPIQIYKNYEYSRGQMKETGWDDVHVISKRDSRHCVEVKKNRPKQSNNAKPKKMAGSDLNCGKYGYKHRDRECPTQVKKSVTNVENQIISPVCNIQKQWMKLKQMQIMTVPVVQTQISMYTL